MPQVPETLEKLSFLDSFQKFCISTPYLASIFALLFFFFYGSQISLHRNIFFRKLFFFSYKKLCFRFCVSGSVFLSLASVPQGCPLNYQFLLWKDFPMIKCYHFQYANDFSWGAKINLRYPFLVYIHKQLLCNLQKCNFLISFNLYVCLILQSEVQFASDQNKAWRK